MKKIFTFILIAAVLSFNAASAQNRNDRSSDNNRYQVNQPRDNGNHNGWGQSKDYGYNNDRDRNRDYGRNNDYRRQEEYDRMNRDYDRRIDGYRNDRSLDRYERNRRIQQAEQERQQRAKAFGTGVVVGGIAAILLGVLISGSH